jgi:hypothetical protein
MTRRSALLAALAAIVALANGCQSPPPPPVPVIIWKQVGAWSGHGNKQTETFTSDTGGFRQRRETTKETTPGAGTLKVIFRSGDSGREIIDALDVHGIGHDTTLVAAERPRWYYLTIESANVDWSLAVDERIEGQTTTGRF